MTMRTELTVDVNASQDRVFDYLADLANFRELIPIIHAIDPSIEQGERVWDVELRAKVGPFARSKRLHMVRSQCEPHSNVVFNRVESDQRDHAPWVLSVVVLPGSGGSKVTIKLEYGGRLWTAGVLERILRENIDEGTRRLQQHFA